MIRNYLNQTAQWKHINEHDGYNEAIYAEAVEIKVRWEGKQTVVRNKKGEEVISQATVYCSAHVVEGDLLTYGDRSWDVKAVDMPPSLDGKEGYRICYL